jgi:hypothetical protein
MHSSLRETIETEVQTRVEDYGDLVVQNFGSRLNIPAADLPGEIPFDETLNTYDCLGDVDRYGADEAVLLCQKLRMLEVSLLGTYSAETDITFRYQLGFDGEQMVEEETNSFASGTTVDTVDDVDNDTLFFAAGSAMAQFADGGSGLSAGGDTFRTESETNYLTEVGVLPEVSARDSLFEHVTIDSPGAAEPEDGQVHLRSSWQLFWLETDDEIEGRQIDMFE